MEQEQEPESNEVGKQRLEICNKCKYQIVIENHLVCALCGCWLISKTNDSKNYCDAGYWFKLNV